MKSSLIPVALCSALFSCDSPEKTSQMDKIANDTLDFWEVPGCAISIVHGDKVLLCKGYGVKQIGSNNPIDSHTIFPLASITKLFTSCAFDILCEQGKISLDTPVIDLYPSLKLSDPYAQDHLTFRDCLCMRSGLPGPSTDSLLFSKPDITRDELLAILSTLPFPFGFRSHFAYQNLLYVLAETAFTPSYRTFLQQNLLAPLQMNQTVSSFAELQSNPNKITPHIGQKPVPLENLDACLGGAGLSSSAHDMRHFLSFLLSKTSSEVFTPQTIATVEEFTGPGTPTNALFPDAQFVTYGLGCFIHDYRGIRMIQVPGLSDGTFSVLALIPSLELGIFIAANAESPVFARALLFQLIDSFLAQNTNWNQYFLELSKKKQPHSL